MRVALDARWVQLAPRGGVGRILTNLIPLLAEAVDLVLLTTATRPALSLGVEEYQLPTPPPGHAAVWLQWSAPRWLARHPVDVFHCPWYGLPYRQPVPMVATIHDLTFEHHAEWFSRGHRATYRAQARHAARTARRLLTVSEHVRTDIERTYGVAAERLSVARPAVDPVFQPEAGLRSGHRSRRYLVALGGAPRRNLAVALEAWRNVRRLGHDVDLVVAGPPEPVPDEDGLSRAPDASDAEWASMLAGAEAFVYPTLDEGFGMPALEAAASGTPVVCARVGALPEVLGEAAEWCPAPTTPAITEGLVRLLSDGTRRDRLRVLGLTRASAAPTWQSAAEVHVATYEAVAGPNAHRGSKPAS